jgi:ribosomal subunit interface protein
MQITIIENQNVTLPAGTKNYIEEKVTHVQKFLHDDAQASVEVFKGGHGGYEASITLKTEGKLYHAKATRSSVHEGVDEAVDELVSQLKRAHGKAQAMLKRGGDTIKRMMKFGRG